MHKRQRDALLAAVEAKHAIHPALSVSAPVSDGDVGGLVERIFDSVVSSRGWIPAPAAGRPASRTEIGRMLATAGQPSRWGRLVPRKRQPVHC